MKKDFLIASLIGATLLAAAPASTIAQDRNGERGGQRFDGGGDRQRGGREGAPQRDFSQRTRGPERAADAGPQQRVERARPGFDANRRDDRRNDRPDWANNRRDGRPDMNTNRQGFDGRPGFDNRGQDRRVQDSRRPDAPRAGTDRNRWDRDDRRRDDRGWQNDRPNRYGWDDRNYRRPAPNYNWNRDWRRDQRYNWQGFRDRYGDRYRTQYYAPRGWSYGYSRFSIGISLWSGLYSSQYWINDPYYYRLPPAGGSLRWVRYYDDAMLVDVRSGMVVDVIYDFFW